MKIFGITECFLYNNFMIDFLSCPDWINPQIDFLVMLQNFRLQHSCIYNKLFLSITAIGEIWFPTLICSIYYWCFNSKNGVYLFSLVGFHFIFGQLAKMLACVYRPWIINSNVHPVEEAMTYARGYSFPSGHSSMAASLFGGCALLSRRNIFICLALILMIFVVGFSRLWLGVHTPQDVIAGFLLGFIIVFGVNFIINWAEKNPKKRYLLLLFIINLFAVLVLIYMRYFNNFPMDYVDGKLLVNPLKAIHTSVVCYGYSLGLINGGFLCRAFFPFDAKEAALKERILRGIIGSVFIFIMLYYPLEYCFTPACNCKTGFILPMIFGFILTAVYPFLFTKVRFRK